LHLVLQYGEFLYQLLPTLTFMLRMMDWQSMKSANNKTILLVDDDPDFLHSVEEAMQNLDYRVITKTDGHDALSVLQEGIVVDVVITDYRMPGMNGLEFMSALRKKGLSMPMILLSAHSDVEIYFKALKLGAYEVTNKPISMKELGAIVKAALSCPTPNGQRALASEKGKTGSAAEKRV
jgi:DNA-binding NtrC family response regulator